MGDFFDLEWIGAQFGPRPSTGPTLDLELDESGLHETQPRAIFWTKVKGNLAKDRPPL